ncbi:hypothetical protein THAOC_22771 [Thalassiosira oceanica]|uniref:Uncharacterized protein n=1 Tax=Thalassiosira oceanica TaxID=159749 RepID=K0SF40_THAOC|nr:hypothetical protein THAOC_22771 [Thalassiosira oceanica]|eukprot:EJK57212.1 hypothetical protein THAOC_22771 [Thalassiosira oceanica]
MAASASAEEPGMEPELRPAQASNDDEDTHLRTRASGGKATMAASNARARGLRKRKSGRGKAGKGGGGAKSGKGGARGGGLLGSSGSGGGGLLGSSGSECITPERCDPDWKGCKQRVTCYALPGMDEQCCTKVYCEGDICGECRTCVGGKCREKLF